MAGNRMRCIVCGRPFYKGQGVVITVGNRRLEFHSKSCALKFLRSLIERIDPDELRRAVEETIEEFEESLKAMKEASSKKI